MRIVIDTNIIISALLYKDSNPAYVLNLVHNNICQPLLSSEILIEYQVTLYRKKFQFLQSQIDFILTGLWSRSEFILANPTKSNFSDSDDKKFYEVAETGQADFLITGNIKHFPKPDGKFQIVTAREFLEYYIYQDQ